MRSPVDWIGHLKTRIPRSGPLLIAAFTVCVLSGLPLLFTYRPGAPLESLARVMMDPPLGVWVRSVHYWSAQCFLAGAVLHLIGLLRRGEETRTAPAAWLRLIAAGPVVAFALVTGFILRGDSAAEQTAAVFRALLHLVPPGGNLLAAALAGSGSGLTLVFWHHVVTAPVALALLLGLQARHRRPERRALAWMLALVAVLSVFLVPNLGAYPWAGGAAPWYLAGLREALRRVAVPGLVAGLGLSAWVTLALLPALGGTLRSGVKRTLAAGLVAYGVLTALAMFRSPSVGAGSAAAGRNFLGIRAYLPVAAATRRLPIASVAGRPEGCLACHGAMTGFSPVHSPAALGCTSCHLGNPFTLDATLAHAGMTLTPGNLSVVRQTCGTTECHADVADRVEGALMNTMSGVVAVDKVVFGERRDLNAPFDVARLNHSPADQHLRHLCASCHLGRDKSQPAATSQQSRGGGCSACHLDYGPAALTDLHRRGAAVAPLHHPDISTRVTAGACFGCHSRSGRISTNFEGWHETALAAEAARPSAGGERRDRVLDDGRVFTRQPADVHFEKGMICTDCHLASEVMGDGAAHAHEEEAVKIACTDCHATRPATVAFTALDPETQRIVALRQLNAAGRRFVRAGRGGVSYPNVFVDDAGAVTVATARGALLGARPPAPACARDISAHARLDCRACHSAWAPQCISCHTAFDPSAEGWDNLAGRPVRGAWQETGGDFRAEPPALGVETGRAPDGRPESRFGIFVPGMILTLNQSTGAKRPPDEFHRLYAPTAPHTTALRGRDCVSCHANPLALGYGRGRLTYAVHGGRGRWEFTPALPRGPSDGLPTDAWIGFLEEPKTAAATRTNVRPLNREEQQRMLLVGACLQCHSEKEPRLMAVFADFGNYRAQLNPRCVLPVWER